MKRHNAFRQAHILVSLLCSFFVGAPAFGQSLFTDPFTYNAGALSAVSGGTWEEGNGTAGLINIIEGSLSHPGYGSQAGNRVELVGTEGFSEIHRRFGTQQTGTVYAAALIRVTGGVSQGRTDQFLFYDRFGFLNLSIQGSAADGSTYFFCLSKQNLSGSCTSNYVTGQTYLIVLAYIFNGGGDQNDVVKLWVDPDLSQPEPNRDIEDGGGVDATFIDHITFEQDTGQPGIEIDELRVATSWAALSAGGGNTPPGQPVLREPRDGGIQMLTGDPNQLYEILWDAATDPDGDTVTYRWQLSADTFATMLIDVDTGENTRYETTLGALATLLTDNGVQLNESVVLKHRVVASDGQAESMSRTFTLNLTRGTLTATEHEDDLPASFYLSTVYPNPFNPEARFTLTVAAPQHVRVAVFDALGRSVAVLYDGLVSAGTAHPFVFEAGDLPSGVYLIRATGETFKAARRAVLAR
ncbi:MAG: T9SS type A sorting domain-containing protein [Rhodothermales bacterium]